ncbi:MAG: ABC transporter substrate-binding protein [Treponema sp.]|jgi:putative aldouronate transport system substrate-binding protein|nr:ABC transporter substrate-binding protein [Treponema sp.]
MKKAIALTLALLSLGSLAFGAARRQSGGVPTVVWYLAGPGPIAGPDLADNMKIMSDYTQEKIGVRFELRDVVDNTRRSVILNSGEAFDIMFSQSEISDWVPTGVFADITDRVPVVAPALWNYVPKMLWDGVRWGGKIYAVPTYKDSSLTVFLFWDKKYVDKYALNTGKRPYTLEDFDRDLRTVKAGEGANFYPYMSAGSNDLWPNLWTFDSVGPGLGVRIDDPTRRVVSTLEQPDTLAKYKILRAWYKEGIVNPDAPQLTEIPRGRTVNFDIAWPSKAQVSALANGLDAYVPIDLNTPFVSTGQVRGSLQAFSANSKYIDESLKLIELVNTDSKLRNMLAFGIEGRNFRYIGPNRIERLTDNYITQEWAQATFFNLATTSDQPETTWDEVRAQNDRAVTSPLIGFSMDNTSIRSEISNLNNIMNRYNVELLYGAVEPEVLIPRIIAELKAVGFDKVWTEAQRQIDEYFK